MLTYFILNNKIII